MFPFLDESPVHRFYRVFVDAIKHALLFVFVFLQLERDDSTIDDFLRFRVVFARARQKEFEKLFEILSLKFASTNYYTITNSAPARWLLSVEISCTE